jgi:hypothetical protein
MVGAAAALTAELRDQRLRTATQVTEATGLEVLAELSRSTSKRRHAPSAGIKPVVFPNIGSA